MNDTGEDKAPPDDTPWYKSVPFRMTMLALFAVAFSWLLGVVVRFIAPF